MLTPKEMSRLLIVGSKDQMAPVISELYRHHLFHLEDFVEHKSEEYEGFKIGTPLLGGTEASDALVKVRVMESTFSIRPEELEVKEKQSGTELHAKIRQELPILEREIEDLTGRRLKLETKVREYKQKVDELLPFTRLPLDLELYRGYTRFVIFAGYILREVALSVPAEVFFSAGKENNFILVVTPTEHRTEVEQALQAAAFRSVPVPEESGNPQMHCDYYTNEISVLKKEIDDIHRKMEKIRQDHTDFLVACEEVLKVQVEQTEAPLRFATTETIFVIDGWVPAENADPLSDALILKTGGKIFVTRLPIDFEHDAVPTMVPVEYENPSFARPSQLIVDTYSRPRYTELDPTLMVSIIYPIFFGLILGDVGYGLILLGMCLLIRKFVKGDMVQQLAGVLMIASISTMIFGLLYSEFFGFALPWASILPSRHLNLGGHGAGHGPNIAGLMIMCIWIGVLHVTLGRVNGIVNHARQDHGSHRTKAMLANAGWIIIIWGILCLIWSLVPMPYMPDFTTLPPVIMGRNVASLIGAAMIGAGILFIARESALEVVELPTIFSNILSYTRIFAVGISSVAIAMVINFIAIEMLIQSQLENITILSGILIVVGVVVFVGGQLLNTLLGILGGGIHSLRLHYVEFFTKFYKGGGKKYSPFGLKRRFTED